MEGPNEGSLNRPSVSRNIEQLESTQEYINQVLSTTIQCSPNTQRLSIQILAKKRKNSWKSLQCIVYKKPKKMPSLKDLEKMFEIYGTDIETTENKHTLSERLKKTITPILDDLLQKNNNTDNELFMKKCLNSVQSAIKNNDKQTPMAPEIEVNRNVILDLDNSDQPISNKQNTHYKIDLTGENSDDSNNSVKTVEYHAGTLYNGDYAYSPQPSTSSHNDITQSELLSNECVVRQPDAAQGARTQETTKHNENIHIVSNQDDVEIIENNYETIVIEDELPETEVLGNSSIINIDDYFPSDNTNQSSSNSAGESSILGINLDNVVDNNNHKNIKSNEVQTQFAGNSDSHSLGECPICLDPLSYEIASTMCGHLFCIKCIKIAIKQSGKKCPKCRKYLKKPFYHHIYI